MMHHHHRMRALSSSGLLGLSLVLWLLGGCGFAAFAFDAEGAKLHGSRCAMDEAQLITPSEQEAKEQWVCFEHGTQESHAHMVAALLGATWALKTPPWPVLRDVSSRLWVSLMAAGFLAVWWLQSRVADLAAEGFVITEVSGSFVGGALSPEVAGEVLQLASSGDMRSSLDRGDQAPGGTPHSRTKRIEERIEHQREQQSGERREFAVVEDREEVMMHVYGACSDPSGIGGWAALLSYGGHEDLVVGSSPHTTYNRMELQAVIQGLKLLKRKEVRVDIYVPSKHIYDAFELKRIQSWKRRGWRRAKGRPVKNRDLWAQLLDLVESHDVRFHVLDGERGSRVHQAACWAQKKHTNQHHDAGYDSGHGGGMRGGVSEP